MQVLLVLLPAQRLLLYLIELVDPEAVGCLPVAVLLRPLSLGHIGSPFRLLFLSVGLGRRDRLRDDAVPLLLGALPLSDESLMVETVGLLVSDVAHLAHQVIRAYLGRSTGS